jgi:hypothetical protein
MRRRPFIAIIAAVLLPTGLQTSANPAPPAGFLTQFEWPSDDPLAGGFSALELSSDGTQITVISDRGTFSTGQISRDTQGMIAKVDLAPLRYLKGKTNTPLALKRNDSEGLAIAADGTAYVSFEGAARVLRYAKLDGVAENLPSPPAFEKLQINSALEALAIDADGTLYTIPERSGDEERPFPIYRFKDGAWDNTLALPRVAGFLPVGADFGPDGKLYVLERQFHGLSGFSSRLSRYAMGADKLGAAQVLMQSPVGFHDNLEGVSIWRDGAGVLRATMIADDNFLPFLSSGLVEYRLPD